MHHDCAQENKFFGKPGTGENIKLSTSIHETWVFSEYLIALIHAHFLLIQLVSVFIFVLSLCERERIVSRITKYMLLQSRTRFTLDCSILMFTYAGLTNKAISSTAQKQKIKLVCSHLQQVFRMTFLTHRRSEENNNQNIMSMTFL